MEAGGTIYPDAATLAAVIARSPIVVAAPREPRRLPDGFELQDIAILEWIAAEGRRAVRSFAPI
jgi:hypothetical protein